MTGCERPAVGERMLDTGPLAFAQLDRLQSLFGRVEAKVSFLFAINLGLLGSTAVNVPWRHPWGVPGLLSLIASLLLGFSTLNLYAAFYPHLRASRPSLLYFDEVSKLAPDDYIARVKGLTADALADDALCQVWRNSEILRKKFARSRTAFILTGLATFFWFALLMVATANGGKLPALR